MKKECFKKALKKGLAVATAFVVGVSVLPGITTAAKEKIPAEAIEISNPVSVLAVGDRYNINKVFTPENSTDKVKFSSSDTSIADIDSHGIFTVKKSGTVKITATSTSGAKDTCTILCVSKYGVSSVQSRIDKMLAAKNIKNVYVYNTANEKTYTIGKGSYGNKILRVRAPYSDVDNYGEFTRAIRVFAVKNGTFTEHAKGNSFSMTGDKEYAFTIAKDASVKLIKLIGGEGAANIKALGELKDCLITGEAPEVNMDVTGVTGEIKIETAGKITLTGTPEEKVTVVVGEKAENTELVVSVPVELEVSAPVNLVMEEGSEGSKIVKTDADIKVEVENKSTENVEIATEGTTEVEVIKPETPVTGGNGGTYIPPTTPTQPETVNEEIKGTFNEVDTVYNFNNVPADKITGVKVSTASGDKTLSTDQIALLKEAYNAVKNFDSALWNSRYTNWNKADKTEIKGELFGVDITAGALTGGKRDLKLEGAVTGAANGVAVTYDSSRGRYGVTTDAVDLTNVFGLTMRAESSSTAMYVDGEVTVNVVNATVLGKTIAEGHLEFNFNDNTITVKGADVSEKLSVTVTYTK